MKLSLPVLNLSGGANSSPVRPAGRETLNSLAAGCSLRSAGPAPAPLPAHLGGEEHPRPREQQTPTGERWCAGYWAAAQPWRGADHEDETISGIVTYSASGVLGQQKPSLRRDCCSDVKKIFKFSKQSTDSVDKNALLHSC